MHGFEVHHDQRPPLAGAVNCGQRVVSSCCDGTQDSGLLTLQAGTERPKALQVLWSSGQKYNVRGGQPQRVFNKPQSHTVFIQGGEIMLRSETLHLTGFMDRFSRCSQRVSGSKPLLSSYRVFSF